MPVDTAYCTCPTGWPRVIEHAQKGGPIAAVQHHWGQCWRSSIRVSGVRRPRAVFEEEVVVAAGQRGKGA